MKLENNSNTILAITRSKAKMYEYDVPLEHHIDIPTDLSRLFVMTIAILGDAAVRINSDDKELDYKENLNEYLQFSAQFFDCYIESKLNNNIDYYLTLISSASYYLCDLPGSSLVLAKKLVIQNQDLGCYDLDQLLLWLLKGDFATPILPNLDKKYSRYITQLSKLISAFYSTGIRENEIQKVLVTIRSIVYLTGNPRELFFGDIIVAVTKKKIANSSWKCLPLYSDLQISSWIDAILKDSFIKELWPSQRVLGEQGVLRGNSAIIQMPTSAGKTKAIEIIVRSGFLSNRTSLAVIVAPFKALCHEIKNNFLESFKGEDITLEEISDVPQIDFDMTNLAEKTILVLTPEKMMYLLRHSPGVGEKIGLLIYDEGHQFDNGSRGVIYELLLSTLKSMIPENAQTVLISAVINNAEIINKWLNGEKGIVVTSGALLPTYRTIAFTSWQDRLGRLEFIDKDNPEKSQYFVPRILEQIELNLKKRETVPRYFPDKSDGKSIAIYLALKLISKGSVAIFCGRKNTVTSLCKLIIDYYSRELAIDVPSVHSNLDEVNKLYYLHSRHLGEKNVATLCSRIGIYCHSTNVPQGLRLAIEYAMQKSIIKFLICTSTLSQGVNLPIRYLIVTSIYQAQEKIKTRDFHNLIGRAGRSGMHTEGSILFSDPDIFDKRTSIKELKRWSSFKELLDPRNSELCTSEILGLFSPIYNDYGNRNLEIDILAYVTIYLRNPDELKKMLIEIANQNSADKYSVIQVLNQAHRKNDILKSIESYLMAHWEVVIENEGSLERLAKETLAYQICNEVQKSKLIQLFQLLGSGINDKVSNQTDLHVYGKTLYGLFDSVSIKEWVLDNLNNLLQAKNYIEIISILWPIISRFSGNETFIKGEIDTSLQNLLVDWVHGISYYELHHNLVVSGAKRTASTLKRKFTLEDVISICSHTVSYNTTLLLGAIGKFLLLINSIETEDVIKIIDLLQKQFKYGLPCRMSIALYEMGFSDRIIALELAEFLNETALPREKLIFRISQKKEVIKTFLKQYPSYYTYVLEILTAV
jgi:POLQ-like helicase